MPASVAQSKVHPTGDQEVADFIPAGSGHMLLLRLIMKYFLRSFCSFSWFKKGRCQFLAKECAQALVGKVFLGKPTGSTCFNSVYLAVTLHTNQTNHHLLCAAFRWFKTCSYPLLAKVYVNLLEDYVCLGNSLRTLNDPLDILYSIDWAIKLQL